MRSTDYMLTNSGRILDFNVGRVREEPPSENASRFMTEVIRSVLLAALFSAGLAAGTPTLVQHVATGMDRYPVTSLHIPLPNPTGGGNALILGIQFQSSGSISSVADDKGNAWVAGPTVTNSNASQRMNLYYALDVIGGTQNITITFSGLGSTNGFPQAVISEFYNIAQASAIDGSSGSATSRTPGEITTTTAGDLIYHWGVDFSDTNVNGGAYNGSSITAGAGFTLLSADLQVGSADQYQIQSSAGTITPTFTASGSATWGSLALALKSANAGTPPPSGIRIVHIQHTLLNSVRAQGRANPIVMQFPSSGNLLVGLYNSADCLISNVTDSAGNTWASAGSTLGGGQNTQAQIVYAANAITSATLGSITVALNGTTQGDNMFDLYDVAGAATSPFDKSATASGNQTSPGNLTTTTLTPSTANGLVLNVLAIDFHTINGIVGSGYILDSDVNKFDNDDPPNGGTDVGTIDMDNGYSHIYNTTTSPVTFVYTYTETTPGGVQTWGSVAAAFVASSSGSGSGGALNACDLNADGTVSVVDVQLAVNMDLGLLPCTANVDGAGVCNVVVVQRVVNAVLGGPCVTGTGSSGTDSVDLTWTASTSLNVAGYNVYRGTISGGPYTKLNSSLLVSDAYTDNTVQAGQTYYYVATSVDTTDDESAYSSPPVQAIIP